MDLNIWRQWKLRRKQESYQAVFQGPQADVVLDDLAQFCRASESTFHPDPRLAAMLDGRREVFLRIQEYLKLPPEALLAIKLRESSHEQHVIRRHSSD